MAMTKKTDPIEQYLNTTGSGWCIKYVLIAVVEDEDSDQSFYIQCMENQTAAETIGLCEAVSHIQKVKIANAWIAREEDTDE
jgi:hypothetical protein